MEKIELFSAQVCPFAHRSRLALIEKNLPFTLIEINLRDKPDWYAEVNPVGAVPALRQGDFLLRESLVINEYVNELSESSPLLPDTAQQRAEARLWIDYASNQFVPLFYRILRAQDQEEQQRLGSEMIKVLKQFDDELQRRKPHGYYWFGWQVGLTDIAIYPWFERWAVLEHYRGLRIPEEFKALFDWLRMMQGRESVCLVAEPAAFYVEQYADYAAGRK